jgi:hypothetical protein
VLVLLLWCCVWFVVCVGCWLLVVIDWQFGVVGVVVVVVVVVAIGCFRVVVIDGVVGVGVVGVVVVSLSVCYFHTSYNL